MTSAPRVAFIGAGNMARAIIEGLLAGDTWSKDELAASDLQTDALEALAGQHGLRTFERNEDAVGWAEVVVLAVKPQVLLPVLSSFSAALQGRLLISIAAGVPAARIESQLPDGARVVRVMPNTPALVGQAASAIAPGSKASNQDVNLALRMFRAVGTAQAIPESLMDAVTGLSGSGPAYVFLIIEALSDAGVKAGLPRTVATELASQTLLGAAELVKKTGKHPGALKDMVTSPGGTTIAGVEALEQAGVRAGLMAAVAAAVRRSKELADA